MSRALSMRTVGLLLGPVEEGVDHVDGRVGNGRSRDGALVRLYQGLSRRDRRRKYAYRNVDGVRVQTEWLTLAVVVRGERALEVLKSRSVVDGSLAVSRVPVDLD